MRRVPEWVWMTMVCLAVFLVTAVGAYLAAVLVLIHLMVK